MFTHQVDMVLHKFCNNANFIDIILRVNTIIPQGYGNKIFQIIDGEIFPAQGKVKKNITGVGFIFLKTHQGSIQEGALGS